MRLRMGIAGFRAGQFPTKGCFSKNGVAYWSPGGTMDEEWRSDLPGVQERIWCEKKAACLTREDCDQKRAEMGMSYFGEGDFPSKGCFSKNGKAYWGEGGSTGDMSTPDLPGVQERIWCGRQTGEEEDIDVACLTVEACDELRQEKDISSFKSGDFPTKGTMDSCAGSTHSFLASPLNHSVQAALSRMGKHTSQREASLR